MPRTVVFQQSLAGILTPAERPEMAKQDAVAWGASLTVYAGDLVGQKVSDKLFYPYAVANRSQTLTITGTLSGGTYDLQATKSDGTVVVAAGIAYNASAATVATALNAVLGASAVGVTGTNINGGLVVTFSGTGYAGKSPAKMEIDEGATTGATGSSVADTSTLTGVEAAMGLSMYPFKTGTDGKPILNADTTTPDYFHIPNHTAPIWQRGTFDLTELKIGGAGSLTVADLQQAFGTGRIIVEPNGFVRIT